MGGGFFPTADAFLGIPFLFLFLIVAITASNNQPGKGLLHSPLLLLLLLLSLSSPFAVF